VPELATTYLQLAAGVTLIVLAVIAAVVLAIIHLRG
jgi:hypothetical protein